MIERREGGERRKGERVRRGDMAKACYMDYRNVTVRAHLYVQVTCMSNHTF